MKKFLFLMLSFLVASILIACEDDPILEPQDETEDGGSYAKLSLPVSDHRGDKKRNSKIY